MRPRKKSQQIFRREIFFIDQDTSLYYVHKKKKIYYSFIHLSLLLFLGWGGGGDLIRCLLVLNFRLMNWIIWENSFVPITLLFWKLCVHAIIPHYYVMTKIKFWRNFWPTSKTLIELCRFNLICIKYFSMSSLPKRLGNYRLMIKYEINNSWKTVDLIFTENGSD